MALPDLQNCSYASPGMCPDLIHPYSTLFHQFGATRSAYGPKRLFLAVLDPLGALWRPRMVFPDLQNCANASPGMCPDLFHPCSTLFHQFGATRSAYGPKRPFLAVLDALGALWRTHMALPDQRNGFNASPGMCPDLFHPCSTLFHQFGATRSAYGRKRPFLAVLDPVWGPSGAPI